jgi:hypothetical protein
VIESGSEAVFKEISFETMKRSALLVNVIETTRSFKMTAYDQYKNLKKKYYNYLFFLKLVME